MRPALHVLLGAVLALPVGVDVDYQLGGVRDVPPVWASSYATGPPSRSRTTTTSATSMASRPSPTRNGSGASAGDWCSSGRAVRWSTRHGVSGCSTFVRRANGRGWPDRRRLDRRDAPRTASTRWSSTISTRSPAAGGCCAGDRRRRTPDCWSPGAQGRAGGRPEEPRGLRRDEGGVRLRGGRGVSSLPGVWGLPAALRAAGVGDRVPPQGVPASVCAVGRPTRRGAARP